MTRRSRPVPAALLSSLLAGLVGLPAAPAAAFTQDEAAVFINELHYDNDGTDTGEFVEVAGPAGTDLTGWTVELYNGGNGTRYDTDPLPATIPSSGVVVVEYPSNGLQNGAPDGVALVDADDQVVQFLSYEGEMTATNGTANGLTSTDTGVAEGSGTAAGQSLQLTGDGSQYGDFTWTGPADGSPGQANSGQSFQPSDGPAAPVTDCPERLSTTAGTATSAPVSARDADSRLDSVRITSTPTEGISLPDITFSAEVGDPATATLVVAGDTAPGSYPVDITFSTDDEPAQEATCTVQVTVVDDEPMPISAVQGSGASSPLEGEQVLVEAVVTSLITASDVLDAFYVQERDADTDNDPATSEGVYVFCRGACPAELGAGDIVQVYGTVVEFFGNTQVDASRAEGSISVTDADQPLPTAAAVTLPGSASTRDAGTFEAVEGMRTTITTTMVVSEYFNLSRYGELVLTANERPYQFTETNAPSADGYAAHLAELAKRRIILDDDSNDENDATSGPQSNEPYYYPPPGLSAENYVRGGDTITDLTGVFEYSFGAWKLRPVAGEDYAFERANPRPADPEDVGGRLKIASFNVLNYFATIDQTSSNSSGACSPSGTADCRGADSEEERERQLQKIVAALTGIDADVFGLIEIENDEGAATEQIVDALNAATTPGAYDYIRTGTIGTDAIKQAFVYKTSTVQPAGDFAVLTSEQDERFVDTKNRPALIQTFSELATGEKVTVAVNHLKSKGSGCGEGDDSAADGSGNCDGTRTRAAQALADYLATDPTGSGDPDVLVIGDLNSYSMERPITALEEAGYTNLLERFEAEESYGYVFDGQLGHLDHALATSSLDSQVTGAGGWKINADELPLLDYNDTVKDVGEASFERKSSANELHAPDAYRSSDHDAVIVGLDLAEPIASPVAVQILNITDFHGRLKRDTNNGIPGAARLATTIEGMTGGTPNTVLTSSGDNIGATPFISAVQKDEPTLDVLNEIALDVSAVGNHEFDRGYQDLAERVMPLADWPYLGANVEGESPDLPHSHIITTQDGVRVGFVGVVTEETSTLVAQDGIAGITFTDPVLAANAAAAEIADEADVIVLLAHEGASSASTTAETCAQLLTGNDAFSQIVQDSSDEIDVIFGGHTHLRVDCEFPYGGDAGTRAVLEARDYGKTVAQLTFTFDPTTGRMSDVEGNLVDVEMNAAEDPAVKAVVDQADAEAAEVGKQVIGQITTDIPRAYTASGGEDRGAESVLGNFIADVQLDATSAPELGGAEIAFMNPGGLRADFLYDASASGEQPGEVTYQEAADVQPFANGLVTMSLTGAQVKSVLEEQWQPDGTSRPFLALGVSDGFFYTFDPDAARGDRIKSITLNGATLDPEATYRVTVNSFLATGGDNFTTLAEGTERQDNGFNDLNVLVEYFQENSPVTPDAEPRRRSAGATQPSPSPTQASPSPTQTGGGGGGGTASPSPTGTTSPSPSPTSTTSPSPSPSPTGTSSPTPSPSQTGRPADQPVATDQEARGVVLPGESVSTDGDQPTEDNPVITTVTSPEGGAVSVSERPTTAEEQATDGYRLLGQAVEISAPDASVEEPLRLEFRLDSSLLPAGENAQTVSVQRNGLVVDVGCAGDRAAPDPCLLSRVDEGGDVVLTVLTSRASTWTFVTPEPGSLAAACPDVTGDSGFADVAAGSVHAAAIACLRELAVTQGVGGEGYRPAQPVTRGQMASFLARLLGTAGHDLPEQPAEPFADVAGVHAPAINALAAQGIVKGSSATTYVPQAPVTRAQMASLLHRAYLTLGGPAGVAAPDAFADDDASVHEPAIDALALLGVTTGVTADSYDPAGDVRRDQMASFLSRLLSRLVAEQTVPTV